MWSGFGQTKVVEDLFNLLRRRENRDTLNKTLYPSRMWQSAVGSDILQLHGRKGVPIDNAAPKYNGALATLYDSSKHTPTVSLRRITGATTWPTFKPMAAMVLNAMLQVQRRCGAEGSWGRGSASWKCMLLHQGLVIQRAGDMSLDTQFLLTLGCVQGCATLGFPLKRVEHGGQMFFILGHPSTIVDKVIWLTCFDFAEYVVLPTKVVSPARMHEFLGCTIIPEMGVTLFYLGGTLSLLQNAALSGFWSLPLNVLNMILISLRKSSCEGDTMAALTSLCKTCLPDHSEHDIARILEQRCRFEDELAGIDVPDDVVDDLCDPGEAEENRESKSRRQEAQERAKQWRSELQERRPSTASKPSVATVLSDLPEASRKRLRGDFGIGGKKRRSIDRSNHQIVQSRCLETSVVCQIMESSIKRNVCKKGI